jgi:hypothetical protein
LHPLVSLDLHARVGSSQPAKSCATPVVAILSASRKSTLIINMLNKVDHKVLYVCTGAKYR